MARRNYKKTKRKLSRKVIHKTRRRTKNRVKKLSKNQSGGMIKLSIGEMKNIRGNIVDATISSAPATKKRVKPTPLSDEQLGQLIINSLFTKVTNVSLIQDSSLYGYILYGTVPEGVLFDTKYLSLREALDTYNTDRGITLQHFCMKLSLVHSIPDADRYEIYHYVDSNNDTHSKRAVSVIRSTKEAHIQKKLHDSLACMRGTSPFVPDVIAHGVFNHEQFESYISLFKSNKLTAATKTGIESTVLHVFTEISAWLQQKNIEDERKPDGEKQNWAVDILLMEYIDTRIYQTLYTLGTLGTKTGLFRSGKPKFNPSIIQTALLTTAAQLACATGVGIILYDSHAKNALSNTSQERVVLVDIGGAIDYNDEDGKHFTLQIFDTMLRGILSGANTFCSIDELCNFFEVDIAPKILKKKTEQKSNILKEELDKNLDSLVDFRCVQLTIEHIHHNLIMTAFVDFMMYIVEHKGNNCQSRYTMESVYGAGTFSNFSTFLTEFRPNDTTFRSSGTPSDSYDDNLSKVGKEILEIVKPCVSVKCPIDLTHLTTAHRLLHLPPIPPGQALTLSPELAQSPPTVPQPPPQSGCLIM